ncbi:MAG: FAD-dependent oxidoreductase [Armatimonadota bacterium]|nr:FAD-dependent oxidoreductase [Armatimonadota bacterium]
MHELIIIGAGPAGLTAGVYAARKQLDTLIISENVGGQTTWSSEIENYLGFMYITGVELVERFEEHVRHFNLRQEFGRVTRLSRIEHGFRVETEDLREFDARAVIVASGKSPRMLNVPGERQFRGKGVTYCSTCDAPLYAGSEVAVIGGGNSGLDAAVQLLKITPKVYIIERTDSLRADEVLQTKAWAAPNVEILLQTLPMEISGDVTVSSISVQHKSTGERRVLPVRGVFVEIGLVPNTDFIADLVKLNKLGEIPVNCAAGTEIPGLFAAGDVTDVPEKQIIIAAGEGAKAALQAYSYLVRLPAMAAPPVMRPTS